MKQIFFLLSIMLSLECQADYTCTISKPSSTLQLPGTIQWQTETPTAWYTLSTPSQALCRGSGPLKMVYTASGKPAGTYMLNGLSYSMFSSSTPGINYIMEYVNWNQSKAWLPVVNSEFTGWFTSSGTGFDLGSDLRIKFVRDSSTRPAGTFQISPFSLATVKVSSNASSWPPMNLNSSGTTLTAKSKSCALISPNIVKLPRIMMSELKEVGALSKRTLFSFSVNCSDAFVKYNVYYYMTDVFYPGNKSTALNIATGAGSARGVVLEVLDGEALINFGPLPTADNTIWMGAAPSANGSLTNTVSVRYRRNSTSITPGSVTAGITMTLVYD